MTTQEGETRKRKQTHQWSDDETSFFLSLMSGTEEEPGFFKRIKTKKISRVKAMEEISEVMRKKGYGVSAAVVDNKWKSLLSNFRLVEDHNNQSGNDRIKEGPYHAEVGAIVGERASTRIAPTSA